MADETKPVRGARKLPEGIRSKYELVVAAAKEAERLNDHLRNRGSDSDEKVTMLALRRIEKGLSKVVYEDPEKASEEQQKKETTFFFGS
ncbi:MAG: DNA-directed RNA polymerase subunit omega [Candidatus Eisenbacteria bacterium]|nr:DNA-directed RNA polymerase subunit omega [Candidatus Latescibacterota bacterium]MBD3303204.1 DNA-directed RNA polymerase subunit omega [Candidatus Eisenbacteria bacterium]